MFLDAPRGFRDPQLIADRVAMLDSVDRIQPLRAWADGLALRRGAVVPQFDPADAGVDARVLLLLEAPGPMTNSGNRRPGSGFISADNDDRTAETAWRARDAAGLHDGVLAWNITPWYLGAASRKPTALELREGAGELLALLPLLPRLDTVILSGRYAQRGWHRNLAGHAAVEHLRLIETWHPGPQAMAYPGRRDELVAAFRAAARLR